MNYSLPLTRTFLFVAVLLGSAPLRAQSSATAPRTQTSATGAIVGRIYNPATREYIRNAEIRIVGTPQVTISEDGGYYRLPNAPVGEITLTATYTGHDSASTQLTVTPGTTSTHDFELTPTGSLRTNETIKLAEFVVSTEREGQAKAMAEQKNAMNVKSVVASDNFGDIAEGNVGEFLKFLPGITLDYVETDTRAARMGGMEARYGYVTLDGGTIANTNTGGFGDDTRQFEFEAVSINNIESIEVNRTLSADMPADAPAGTVNLRTKSALDRKGSQFSYMLGMIGNSYEHSLSVTPRHDDAKHAKTRPTGSFDYSNAFFDNKLGVLVNGAFTNVFKEQFRTTETYDYTSAQAIAAGHPLITAINFKDGPKITEKSSGGLRLDYQPFRPLRISLTSSYTYFSDEIANRNLNFRVSAANLDPSSTLTKVVALPSGANANTRIEQTGSTGDKKTDTSNVALNFTYKQGSVTIDGSGSYSRARQQNGAEHMGAVDQANTQLTRIGWTAERPNQNSADWTFTQTSGPSWYDLNNYGASDAQAGNIIGSRARAKTEQFVGRINAKYVTNWRLPTFFQSGLYEQVTTRHRETFDQFTYTWLGPTGNQLTSPLPLSIADFRISQPWGGNIGSLPVPDKSALYSLIRTNPGYFSQTVANQAANLDAVLASPQSSQEQIQAAYIMQNTRIGRWQLQAGLRYERTSTITSVKGPVPITKNPFALVNATTGVKTAASTPDYINYKWSKGFTKDYGSYDDWLPSLSAKYPFSENLSLKIGYNKAIKRPSPGRIASPITIDAAEANVTIPNPDLQPERSQKLSVALEYYFNPAGSLTLHVFETELKNASDQIDGLTADQVGYGNDPVYSSYLFTTYVNVPGTRRIKGIELSYSQQLIFLPDLFRGTSIFANYARFDSHPRPIQNINGAGWAPQNASGGISYKYRAFNASIAGTWVDESIIAQPLATTLDRGDAQYLDERFVFDVGAGYKISKHTRLFLSGRNAFNAGKNWYFKRDNRMQQKERYGSQWTAGITGTY